MLITCNHRLLKTINFFSLDKLSNRESYKIQIVKNNEKPISKSYYDSFFCMTNLDWRNVFLLPRKTAINMNLRVFQNKSF